MRHKKRLWNADFGEFDVVRELVANQAVRFDL